MALLRKKPAPAVSPERSRRFRSEEHPRFWWHHIEGTDFVPPIYSTLSEQEWGVMEDWYAATEQRGAYGEINVPPMSLMQGLVMGAGTSRVVQLGHFFGYSTLLIGWWLRAMGGDRKLVSIDISQEATDFTAEWVKRAGLGDWVDLYVNDSAAPESIEHAVQTLGSMPQTILLDSSHQYEHTLRELNLWVPRMDPYSIMLLHDTSTYARRFDSGDRGGVQQAMDDWLPGRTDVAFLNLNREVTEHVHHHRLVYKDGCGLGILQKLEAPASA